MTKIRVHELAKKLGRQNREVIETLKAAGTEVKSHMSNIDEETAAMVEKKLTQTGKEQVSKVDTPKTEEKNITAKADAQKQETPKKKKNIIRVFHAQNASDGGRAKGRRPAQERRSGGKTPGQPQGGTRPQTNRQGETAAEKPKAAAPEMKAAETASAQTRPQSQEGQQSTRPAGRVNRENRDGHDTGSRQGERKGERGSAKPRSPRTGEGTASRGPRNSEGNRPQRPQGARPQGRTEDRDRDGRDSREGGRGRGDGKFAGSQGRGSGRSSSRKSDSDMVFAPELTKTSKDSKRERDRENKNKKKDFDKSAGNGFKQNQGGKKSGSKLAKTVQKPIAPPPKQEEKKPEVKEITLPEKLTIRELAEAMKMQPSAIVKKLFMQGVMATVNQEIDFEKAQEIALDFDIIAEKEEQVDVIEELLKEDEEDESKMVPRPPVVCVMGHVDHGKTSLLDAIRNTNVTRGEAGGITQHIGAYVVKIGDQKITFLDTPGHEAFTAMRMRGANATDIAVLVVAADDGVMPQTVEAISHAKAAGVEIIVAINKIDKPSANVERVKQELSEYELIPEDWGGSTIFVPVSAHTGEGIDTLLEMILLTAEVCELKANPNRAARGLVIEAQLDKGKGPVATILVQKGTLHVGDFIAAGACSGKVRAMMDDKGRRVKEAGPSMPVEILGLGDVPNAGEILMSFKSDKEAKHFAGAFVSENKKHLLEETKGKLSLDNLFDQIQASDLKELPIIVKADVQGSVEAVKQSLVKLSNEEVVVRVIHGGVGAVNESDVSLAATSNAIIIGFNVRPDALAKQLAEQEGVDMRLYRVIYQAIEDIEAAMKGMLDPVYEEKVIGHAQIRQLFKASGVGNIAGSYVLDGMLQRNCKVRITREGEQIFEGDLASLKRFKDDVKEVKAGYECGLVFDGFNDIKEEDLVEAYIMVEVPR